MCKLNNKIPCSACDEILCEDYEQPCCPYTNKEPKCELLIEYQILQLAHSEVLQQYYCLLETLEQI